VIDRTSAYALTGAVFSRDRLRGEAGERRAPQRGGNFYVNDKPTGAVVGMQPFGGARGSGTNDKAGSKLNLLRWVSPRAVKETLVSPTAYEYPFMADDPAEGAAQEGAI
jgi:1-pyrroline-5-carboxylate dehydrogenase